MNLFEKEIVTHGKPKSKLYFVNIMSVSFEWDEKKSATNQKKHHISFEEAQTVFVDENALLIHDPDHLDEEDRFVLLGLSAKLRIISARKATPREQENYWKR